MSSSVSIIGAGRLGGALAIALSKQGYEIRELVLNNTFPKNILEQINSNPQLLTINELEKISSEIIFITVPDSKISFIAENLAQKIRYKPVVLHASGALSSEVLKSLQKAGCHVGSLHPLVSVSESVSGAERFKNVFFCIEGDANAKKTAEKIVADLRGKAFSVPTEYKSLYHASAVMASGHLVALFSFAIESLAKCGLTATQAQEILFPLIQSTIENLSAQTPAQALTGTFARADVETLKHHLEALRVNASPESFAVYVQLGLRSLILAQQQGTNTEKLNQMRTLLENG